MTYLEHTPHAATPYARLAPRSLAGLVLCALVMAIDGYDLAAMPLSVPHLSRAIGLPPANFGVALSAVLAGLGIGALLLAPLGDRFGRRSVIVGGAVGLGLTMVGAASGSTAMEFALWRLANGMALGACLPNVTALTSELAPPARRASTLTFVSLGISLGAIAAGLIVPPLVALAGWQAIFVIPGCFTLLLALLLWLGLPADSPHLANAGNVALVGDRSFPLLQLLRPPILGATAIFASLYGINAFALYFVTSWLPTVLPQAGFTLDQASHYLSLQQFGGFVIGLALARLLDRGHAVAALVTTYVLIILALALFGVVAPGPIGWGFLILVAGGGISGAHLAIMAVATGFFPRHLLSTAIGFGVAVGRIGAIGGPLLGGVAIGRGASAPTFFLIAAIPALACLAMALLLPAVQRRTTPEPD